MMLSSITLLSLMGGILWLTALERWDIAMDAITFFFVIFNFSVVGIVAIFYQKVTKSLHTCSANFFISM